MRYSKTIFAAVTLVDLLCSTIAYTEGEQHAQIVVNPAGSQMLYQGPVTPQVQGQQQAIIGEQLSGSVVSKMQPGMALSFVPSDMCSNVNKVMVDDTFQAKEIIENSIRSAASTNHLVCFEMANNFVYDATSSGEISIASFDPPPTQPIVISGLNIRTMAGFRINVSSQVILHKFNIEVVDDGAGLLLSGEKHIVTESSIKCAGVTATTGIKINTDNTIVNNVLIANCNTGIEIAANNSVVINSAITAKAFGVRVLSGMGNIVKDTKVDATGEAFSLVGEANGGLKAVKIERKTDRLNVALPIEKPQSPIANQVIGILSVCLIEAQQYKEGKIACNKVLATQDVDSTIFTKPAEFSVSNMNNSNVTIYYTDISGKKGTGLWAANYSNGDIIVVGVEELTIPAAKEDEEKEIENASGMVEFAGQSGEGGISGQTPITYAGGPAMSKACSLDVNGSSNGNIVSLLFLIFSALGVVLRRGVMTDVFKKLIY